MTSSTAPALPRWDQAQIRIIDADLGRTGRTARPPWLPRTRRLVNQEQVGIIFAYDVTRLARNCTDWYHSSTCAAAPLSRRRSGRHLRSNNA